MGRRRPLEIIKEHPKENRMFQMALAVDTCHGRENYPRNGPGRDTLLAAKIDFRLKQEVVNGWLIAEDKT
jgi:hypothetical protein